MEISYYELLEISRDADKETIKKAYRKLALKYHPDRNQGDSDSEQKFKLINEAYEILSDEKKRALYDRYGKEGVKSSSGGGSGFEDFDLGDIFSSFFGGGFGRGSKQKANPENKYSQNAKTQIQISFKEAVFGCKKTLHFHYKSFCKTCDGSGSKDGALQTCPTCNGKGQVGSTRGFMTFVQTCSACNGMGQIIKEKCSDCKGAGFNELEEKTELEIPEGIDNGMILRVQGKGNILKNGTRGDLHIAVLVEEDANFIRDNLDIYIEFPVFFTQAALGERIKIPTIRGFAFLELPIGAKDKDHFVLENEGVKDIHSNKIGRQIVQIAVQFPNKLSEEQRTLLEELNKSFGVSEDGLHQEQKGFFDRLASWFK
ncbi:molecular chaperone DnaJ [Campylobacter sp. MIT 97-5078]|uniref:molecular chaperone DnaJ n=1 Tax=Campylobacter sp. MIT 97-5078 TaxID=1548153 RepID=UPI0005133A9C|nr:molecular chaperone DnaJ [Campylobacter sp. MIT 97-5078]KGI56764.1 molecular chaperone DnaJ [Campylobacter sp. MIT 97-5078]KGI57235.1 molecular chaperone DnaJ [Campylobacter sp. MIT 97-5078]TQR27616.1 molecular chaperone DnaJ [Campylobacter sp. MIT 97-5078]